VKYGAFESHKPRRGIPSADSSRKSYSWLIHREPGGEILTNSACTFMASPDALLILPVDNGLLSAGKSVRRAQVLIRTIPPFSRTRNKVIAASMCVKFDQTCVFFNSYLFYNITAITLRAYVTPSRAHLRHKNGD
jgi:hypothetical protein